MTPKGLRLRVGVVVWSFDPDPHVATADVLQVASMGGRLPCGVVPFAEHSDDARVRILLSAGVELAGGRRHRGPSLSLLRMDDVMGPDRVLTMWYHGTTAHDALTAPGQWVPAHALTDRSDVGVLSASREKLRLDVRLLGPAMSLLGEIFTVDELLRLSSSINGGGVGSERTLRRRVQELRDLGLVTVVRDNEVDSIRQRVPRFRSLPGVGGRPPELLRYSGREPTAPFAFLRVRKGVTPA